MKKILLAGLLLSITQICYAQIIDLSKQKLKLGIDFKDTYMHNPFIKKAFIFSINVSVDKLGKIDSVYFSKTKDVELKDAIDLSGIRKSVITEKTFFKAYKNSIIIIPVMALNLNDQFISNQSSLLQEWEALFPNVNKFKNKHIVLCKPISFWFVRDVN